LDSDTEARDVVSVVGAVNEWLGGLGGRGEWRVGEERGLPMMSTPTVDKY
jgi:hypothetical protein